MQQLPEQRINKEAPVSNSPFLCETLKAHKLRLTAKPMQDLFSQNPKRFEQFSARCEDLMLDYSKNYVDQACLSDLIKLAERSGLSEKTEAMFSGQLINNTEQRAVLHTALRNGGNDIDAQSAAKITSTKERMLQLADRLQHGELLGYTGKPIATVVNIGVGGSDLGPAMAVDALTRYHNAPARFPHKKAQV